AAAGEPGHAVALELGVGAVRGQLEGPVPQPLVGARLDLDPRGVVRLDHERPAVEIHLEPPARLDVDRVAELLRPHGGSHEPQRERAHDTDRFHHALLQRVSTRKLPCAVYTRSVSPPPFSRPTAMPGARAPSACRPLPSCTSPRPARASTRAWAWAGRLTSI